MNRPKKKTKSKKTSVKKRPEYIGKVQLTRDGCAFVMVEGEEDDIYVRPSKSRNALNGDIVRVVVSLESTKAAKKAAKGSRQPAKKDSRKREGEIVAIVERSKKPFVGILHTVGSQAWVLMQSRNMPYDIEVDAELAAQMGAVRGMKVAVVVDDWKRGEYAPCGHLVDVLGDPGQNDTEMHAILAEYNLPYRFAPEVENAADEISDAIGAEELKGRRDFRDTLTFTIDPSDAKDFDDALSFKKLENGNFEIGVHIADVSHYVRPGSLVDKEARDRGTSVYLVDRTVPMLPEKLCNKLCSLREGEDKLVFSTVFEISPRASIKSRWIGRAVIRSDRRLDYEQAQQIIDAGAPKEASAASDGYTGSIDADLQYAVYVLNKLAITLRKAARRAGAIDFDRPEMKVVVDEQGRPIDVYQKLPMESNSLIEQFMLLANRTVAEYVATCGKMNGVPAKKQWGPFVYRVHGEPNELKLDGLRIFAKGLGYKLEDQDKLAGRAAAHSLNKLLEAAKGRPEYLALETLALRAMAKACYSTDNIGHYGLAFQFYTHFTSPIRRYPDLMVHRLLAEYLAGHSIDGKTYYEQECKYASEREQIASDAERTSIKYKLVEYMQGREGQEYDGAISGLTEWGMYVEIEPSKIEGMVALRDIRSDYFEFDEKHYRLIGRRSHRKFRLGDKVRIRVKAVNLEQRFLDFELL